MLKQMRKNLKAKIRAIIDKFGPEMFEDFDQFRVVKRKGSVNSENNLLSIPDHRNRNSEGNGSFISRGSAQDQFSYYHQLELNNVFETLNVTY